MSKTFAFTVPPHSKAGDELKMKFPGRDEKVVIKLPEGAQPGQSIQFTVPEDGSAPQGDGLGAAVGAAVKSGKNETDHAAIRIQAKMRGKSTRNAHMARMNTQGFLVPTEEEAPPVPDTPVAAPVTPKVATVPETSSDSSSGSIFMFVIVAAVAAAAYFFQEDLAGLLQGPAPPPPPPPPAKFLGIF